MYRVFRILHQLCRRADSLGQAAQSLHRLSWGFCLLLANIIDIIVVKLLLFFLLER